MTRIIKLYKDLLLESSKFKSYYYRHYFQRKIRSQFSKHINAENQINSDEILKKSEDMLEMLKRQTAINNAYKDSKLIIEQQK